MRFFDYSVNCPRTRREFDYEILQMLLSNPPNLPAAEVGKANPPGKSLANLSMHVKWLNLVHCMEEAENDI